MTKLPETILASEKPEERRRPNPSYKISFQIQTSSQEEIKKVPVRWKRIYKLRPRQEAQRSTSIHRVHHGGESNQDKKKLVESRKTIKQGCEANYQIVLSIIRALSFTGGPQECLRHHLHQPPARICLPHGCFHVWLLFVYSL